MFRPRSRDRRRGSGAAFFPGATLDMGFASSQYLGATPSSLTVTRASDGYAEDASGSWSVFTSNVPRITNRGLLVEEARTNSALRSDEFDNASWTKSSVTVSANSLLSPFGAVDADTLTASGANGTCTQAVTTAAVSWTFSVFLRRLTGTGNVQITMDGTTWVTQTITDTAWTRCSVTQTGVAGTSNPGIRIVTSGDAVYASCAQAELGAFATSPIRTTTVAVTRAADAVSLTGGAFSSWYTNAAAGTLFAEYVTNGPAYAVNRYVAAISDNTASNRASIFQQGDGLAHSFRLTNGGASTFNVNAVLPNGAGIVNKTVLAWNGATTGNAAASATLVGADDATVTAPTSPTHLYFGINEGGSTNHVHGYIRRVAYFPSRIANAELQALTT